MPPKNNDKQTTPKQESTLIQELIPKTLDRKRFLKFLANLNFVLLSNTLFPVNLFGKTNLAKNPIDETMELNVAMARALAHKPSKEFSRIFKDKDEYEIRRSATLSLLVNKAYLASDFSFPQGAFSDLVLNVDPDPLYKTLTADIPQADILKGLNTLDKDTVSLIGTAISGVTGLAGAVFPGIAIPMAVGGAIGSSVSIKSSLMKDKISRQTIGESSLLLAQLLWNDPKAKKIMTTEVKGVLRDAFGVDFGASIDEHRKHLPDEIKAYVDIYLDSKGLSPEQLQARENATMQTITSSMNKALDKAVGEIIDEMKSQQQAEHKRQIEQQYYDGEIRGGVYLVGVLAQHFMSPQGAKIVNAFVNSAVQMDMMLTALSMGALGPVGMAAGCVMIALNLLGVFGSKGPSADQLIMEAIGKVQESIFALHKEMRELFGIVIENQQKMMERIDEQFELLKAKQNEALRQLREINDEVKLLINESRIRGRNEQSAELNRKILSLNTQINKKLTRNGTVDKSKIEELIEECYTYAINTTKYDDFTALPNPNEAALRWNPKIVMTILRTSDHIDHFVGIIPIILQRFSPQQNIKVINNPKALGRAAMAMSFAYFMFPNIAKAYERGRLKFNKELRQLITDSKNSLSAAVSAETIKNYKNAYIDTISKLLEESLKIGEQMTRRNNSIPEEKEIKLLLMGPLMEVNIIDSEVTLADKSWFPDNVIMEKDVLSRDATIWNVMNIPKPAYIPEFKTVAFKGLKYLTPEESVSTNVFFAILEQLDIVKVEQGEPYSKQIIVKTYDGINEGPYAGEYRQEYSAEETCIANKITIYHIAGNTTVIGDGQKSGWIKSKVSNQKFTMTAPLPLPEDSRHYENKAEKNIEYISKDLLSNEYVNGSSTNFLNKLIAEFNFLVRLRTELVRNMSAVITEDQNLLSLEFEASAVCLKYLAGINTYLKTGDVELGTSVSKDQIVGINVYMKQDQKGDIGKEKDTNFLLSTRHDLAQLISKITTVNYLTNSDYLKEKIQFKDYIKREVIAIAKKMFDEYTSFYFSNTSNMFCLPELTLSEVMLTSAQKSISKR